MLPLDGAFFDLLTEFLLSVLLIVVFAAVMLARFWYDQDVRLCGKKFTKSQQLTKITTKLEIRRSI